MTPPLLMKAALKELLHPDRQASKIPLSTRDLVLNSSNFMSRASSLATSRTKSLIRS
jgi:hypothetical protein